MGSIVMTDIVLFLNHRNQWLAEYPNDKKILDLFNLSILPTPFTAETPQEIVAEEIKQKNPDSNIYIKTQLETSQIAGNAEALYPYPVVKELFLQPWELQLNSFLEEKSEVYVLPNFDAAKRAALFAVEPDKGGYHDAIIYPAPNKIITHESTSDLMLI